MRPHLLFHDNQIYRAHNIVNYINNNDFDVVLLQEAFDKTAIDIIIKNADYTYNILPIKSTNTLINNGLLILSKHKILCSEYIMFNACKDADCLASKGAVFIELLIGDSVWQLVNTHLQANTGQANEKIRMNQFKQIKDLLDKNHYFNIPQLIIGDINEEPIKINLLTDILKALHIGHNMITWGCPLNSMTCQKAVPQILDHVFTKNTGDKMILLNTEFIELSDHYPLRIDIINRP